MPFTSPKLNAISTVARFMFGGHPHHIHLVSVYYALQGRKKARAK